MNGSPIRLDPEIDRLHWLVAAWMGTRRGLIDDVRRPVFSASPIQGMHFTDIGEVRLL